MYINLLTKQQLQPITVNYTLQRFRLIMDNIQTTDEVANKAAQVVWLAAHKAKKAKKAAEWRKERKARQIINEVRNAARRAAQDVDELNAKLAARPAVLKAYNNSVIAALAASEANFQI